MDVCLLVGGHVEDGDRRLRLLAAEELLGHEAGDRLGLGQRRLGPGLALLRQRLLALLLGPGKVGKLWFAFP